MRIESRARFLLAQLPTPIEKLKSLSRELGGPELLIKRDDQTGLALGGNKDAQARVSCWAGAGAGGGHAGHCGRGAIESLSPDRGGRGQGRFAVRAFAEWDETRVAEWQFAAG